MSSYAQSIFIYGKNEWCSYLYLIFLENKNDEKDTNFNYFFLLQYKMMLKTARTLPDIMIFSFIISITILSLKL